MSATKEHRRLMKFLKELADETGHSPEKSVKRNIESYEVKQLSKMKWVELAPAKARPIAQQFAIQREVDEPEIRITRDGLDALRKSETSRKEWWINLGKNALWLIWSPVAAFIVYALLPATAPIIQQRIENKLNQSQNPNSASLPSTVPTAQSPIVAASHPSTVP